MNTRKAKENFGRENVMCVKSMDLLDKGDTACDRG